MLKITLHDAARTLRFRLEGKLAGPWVAELRQCWITASSAAKGRETVVDLAEVDFVDPAGEDLLGEMHRQGVRLKAETPVIRAVVEEVVRARYATVEGQPSARKHAIASSHKTRNDAGAP